MQLNNVWVTGIVGNPVYVACKHCRTKIDAETGHCKRHDTHSCQTERDEEMAILATVNLADHTGEIERILADEKSLCALAGVAAKSQLLSLLEKSGSQAICFKNPVDVRLATNMRKSSNVRSNVPEATHGVLQTQESVRAQQHSCRNASFRWWLLSLLSAKNTTMRTGQWCARFCGWRIRERLGWCTP